MERGKILFITNPRRQNAAGRRTSDSPAKTENCLRRQRPVFPAGQTVYETVASGLNTIQARLDEYEALTSALEKHNDAGTLEQLHELQVQLDATDAWNLNNRVETILDRLSLDGADPDRNAFRRSPQKSLPWPMD